MLTAYLDLDSNFLLEAPLGRRLRRLDLEYLLLNPMQLQLVSRGTAFLRDPGVTISIVVKASGVFEGQPLTTVDFARPADATGYYTANVPASSAAIIAALAGNIAAIYGATGQIVISAPGLPPDASKPFEVQINNSCPRSSDGAISPTDAMQTEYFPAITALTGGTATCLDGIATVTIPLLFVAQLVINSSASSYQLQSGAANTGAGDIAPADFDADTNNKKWVKVGGF
jgi:hypothetical protein